MKRIFGILLALVLVGCSNGNRNSGPNWSMDPRLKAQAEWAYACALEVSGLEGMTVPKVEGVDEPWGSIGAFGMYWWPSRHIRVQITRPPEHVVNIMLHEMGHDVGYRLGDRSEDYANWINNQCKEKMRPDIYPAPPIDWDATSTPQPRRSGGGLDHE